VSGKLIRRLGHVAAHVRSLAIGATWVWLLAMNLP